MTRDKGAAIAAFLEDIEAAMNGTGRHEGHTLTQVGRCVYCSCGLRYQGTIPPDRR